MVCVDLNFIFQRKQEEWKIVFWLTSGIYLFGYLVYFIFADVKLQPWAKEKQSGEQDRVALEKLLKN